MIVDYGKNTLTIHSGPQETRLLIKALNRLKKKEDVLAKLVRDLTRLQDAQDAQREKESA